MTFLDKLLDYYHLSKADYDALIKDVNESCVPHYASFQNIEKIRDKIKELIANKEKILIYGDYDADGILATSILYITLKKLNADISYYIPSRYIDGYGLTSDKVIKAKENGFNAIITVDNGVNALKAIDKANELNIALIITDHHEYNNQINTPYLLHPKLSKLNVTTSGAMVAFYLSYALLEKIDPYLLTLGAISIYSDIMPMKGTNHDIAKLANKYLNRYKFGKINLLSESIYYDENVLCLNLIPKINAIGRIESKNEANILVKYFTSDRYLDQLKMRDYINSVNIRRKEMAKEIIANVQIDKEEPAIILTLDILSGMTGLIANRLLTKYNKVTCIFSSQSTDDCLRASMRSKNGLNVMDFINNNKELFQEFGGHQLAAGFLIKKENIEIFKQKLNEFAKNHPFIDDANNIIIHKEDINYSNYKIIRSLAPFGHDFNAPIFNLRDINVNEIKRTGKNNDTLIVHLFNNAKIIGFRYDFTKLKDQETISFVGRYNVERYKGYEYLNFIIE